MLRKHRIQLHNTIVRKHLRRILHVGEIHIANIDKDTGYAYIEYEDAMIRYDEYAVVEYEFTQTKSQYDKVVENIVRAVDEVLKK